MAEGGKGKGRGGGSLGMKRIGDKRKKSLWLCGTK